MELDPTLAWHETVCNSNRLQEPSDGISFEAESMRVKESKRNA